MVTIAASSYQRVILQNISWQTFETILAEMVDAPSCIKPHVEDAFGIGLV